MVCQDSRSLAPLGPKRYQQFEFLLVKVFSLKQKRNQILPPTIKQSCNQECNHVIMFIQNRNFVEISNHAFK